MTDADRAVELDDLVNGHPENVGSALPELLELLARNDDPETLVDIAFALGHCRTEQAAVALLPLAAHPDAGVRLAVTQNLPVYGDVSPAALQALSATLVARTADDEDEIRNWACFGFVVMPEADTPAVRDALAARLADPHVDTRCEALRALAQRQDARAWPAVRAALERDNLSALELEAAAYLADAAMHELLVGHVDGWDGATQLVADAAWRLTNPAGLGDDLAAGLAESYLMVVRGERATPGPSRWWELAGTLHELRPDRLPELAAAVRARLAGHTAALESFALSWLGADVAQSPSRCTNSSKVSVTFAQWLGGEPFRTRSSQTVRQTSGC